MRSTRGGARGRRAALYVTGAVLASVGLGTTTASAQDQPQPSPIVGTNGQSGYVTITATTPESGGGSSRPAGGGGGSPSRGGGGSGSPSAPLVNPYGNVGVTDAQYASAPGYYNTCAPISAPGAAAANPALVNQCLTGGPPAAPGQPAAAPVPNPVVVAQSAISKLNLQAATPRLSAVDHTAVGLPVWMWVDPGPASTGPLTATATAGPTTATATATLSRIEWSMGPSGATVTCQGPGTPVAAGTPLYAGQNSPTCGYSYELRSLPERTGGTGRWPVTATSVWTITWAGGGQTGGQELPLTARTDLEVGELQAVITGGR